MKAIAQKRLVSADVYRFVESDRLEVGPGDVLVCVPCATDGQPRSPTLRGAAYIAALKGDPWRPQV